MPDSQRAPEAALQFTRSEARTIAGLVQRFTKTFQDDVATVIAAELRGVQPAEVQELIGQLAILERQLLGPQKVVRVHESNAPLLKRVILSERRAVATEIDGPLQKAIDPQVIKMLRRDLDRFAHTMAAPWFEAATAQPIPEVTDYLSIRHAEAARREPLVLAPRELDEKFHILDAPRLFLPDLAYYRARCGLRRVPVAIAYMDIDDFKSFNTRLGETRVDLDLLTPFMEAIEAHVFGHGHAYRFGGDEYVLTLPNMTRAWAVEFARAMQERIAKTAYRGVSVAPTLSIGLIALDAESFLTDREALGRANAAKTFAKETKKGSVATFDGPLYRDEDRVIA
jgi:diguanylate cyclase (GGDEF)-like protein